MFMKIDYRVDEVSLTGCRDNLGSLPYFFYAIRMFFQRFSTIQADVFRLQTDPNPASRRF